MKSNYEKEVSKLCRRFGTILSEKDWMTWTQVDMVLKELFDGK